MMKIKDNKKCGSKSNHLKVAAVPGNEVVVNHQVDVSKIKCYQQSHHHH